MNKEERLAIKNECLLKYSKEQMIEKFIDELDENFTLSNLWCKSQEENEKLKQSLESRLKYSDELDKKIEVIDKAIEYINHAQSYGTMAQVMPHLKPYVNGDDLLNILQGDDNNAKD